MCLIADVKKSQCWLIRFPCLFLLRVRVRPGSCAFMCGGKLAFCFEFSCSHFCCRWSWRLSQFRLTKYGMSSGIWTPRESLLNLFVCLRLLCGVRNWYGDGLLLSHVVRSHDGHSVQLSVVLFLSMCHGVVLGVSLCAMSCQWNDLVFLSFLSTLLSNLSLSLSSPSSSVARSLKSR
jgi:hypothetical protein